MATYNGAEYIREQLDSFVRQTRQPDELVVSDDGSVDKTLALVRDFASHAPFPVRIFQNETTEGCTKNFDAAMHRCTGDLIFLSDQDDVWLPGKLERIEQEFLASPDVWVTINDAAIVDEHLVDTGLTKRNQIRALNLPDAQFITGCCSALRNCFMPLISPIPADDYTHDAWLHAVADRLGGCRLIPESLQYYRRHRQNTSQWLANSTTPLGSRDLFRAYAADDPRLWCERRLHQLETLATRIEECGFSVLAPLGFSSRIPEALRSIKSELAAVNARMSVLRSRRVIRWLPALQMYMRGQYSPFSGWKSLAKDILRA